MCIELHAVNMKRCLLTIATTDDYLGGVSVLLWSLYEVGRTKYPTIVMYTKDLKGVHVLEALRDELNELHGKDTIILWKIDYKDSQYINESLPVHVRTFYTKLRIFEIYKMGFDQGLYIDSDIACFAPFDTIFEEYELKDPLTIAAAEDCMCPSEGVRGDTPAYFNTGVILFHSSKELEEFVTSKYEQDPLTPQYTWPDQDFLNVIFSDKWTHLERKYNGLKCIRQFHPDKWIDDDIVFVHYTPYKPWSQRIPADMKTGYRDGDGLTHSWWWLIWKMWKKKLSEKNLDIVKYVEQFVEQESPDQKIFPAIDEARKLVKKPIAPDAKSSFEQIMATKGKCNPRSTFEADRESLEHMELEAREGGDNRTDDGTHIAEAKGATKMCS